MCLSDKMWKPNPISNCGEEGFKEEIMRNEDDEECQDYLKEIGVK